MAEAVDVRLARDADPGPDPEDELFELGERCATAYMQADALQYKAMVLLAEFHHRQGWKDTGLNSTAEWLAWRIGIRLHTAQERLRTALALKHLPLTSQAMENGELSFTKVRALTRAATPKNEAILLEYARAGSAANLEKFISGYKLLDRKSEVKAEQLRHERRRFSAFVDTDGMVVVRGRLDPEVGALLMRAVEVASDALYRDEAQRERERERAVAELGEATPEQRRADAVGLLAERALAGGFGEVVRGEEASAPLPAVTSGSAPISGSRADRYLVMLHVDGATLSEDTEPGLSELDDGTRVSAETSRRLACDCGVVKIHKGPDGQVQGAGRRVRTVNPGLRRALEARDRGCRFPGCELRFTEAHHVKHWADGGETSLQNLALLCRRHHRAVHEGGVTVCIDVNGRVVFFTPKGKALLGAPPRRLPPPKRPGGSALELRTIQNWAGAPDYRYDRNIPWEVEARALEAVDPKQGADAAPSSPGSPIGAQKSAETPRGELPLLC